MSHRPEPGKLRASNLFLKKDREATEAKKKKVPPPSGPPPASKFTPAAVAKRESKRKSDIEAELEAAAATATNVGDTDGMLDAVPPPPSLVSSEEGEPTGAPRGNPSLNKPTQRGKSPKSKPTFRSSLVSSTEEIQRAIESSTSGAAPSTDDADATAAPARAFDDPDPHRTSPDPKCTAFAPSDAVPDANHLLPDIYQRGLLWIVRFPSTHSPHLSCRCSSTPPLRTRWNCSFLIHCWASKVRVMCEGGFIF